MSSSYPLYKNPYCPINNKGNQCYMISGLQCLWSIPGLRELFSKRNLTIEKINKFTLVKTANDECRRDVDKNKCLLLSIKYIFDKFKDFEKNKEVISLEIPLTKSLKKEYGIGDDINKN